MRPGAIGVAAVAIALVIGGLFFGLGGLSGDTDSADSVPRATLPPSTVAPPAPAVVGTEPSLTQTTVTFPEGTATLPVPNVIGVGQAIAEARLSDFEVQVTTVIATEAEFLDAVSEQTPEAAARLPAGGTVSITLSLQPTPETIPADPVPVGEFTGVDLSALEAGDCGNGAVAEGLLVYDPVDCDEFHDVQLITRFDVVNAPDDYDELELNALVREQCEQPYEEFVGVDTLESELFLRSVRPNEVRYATEGERLSVCLLVPSQTVRIQGSAEGSLW